MWRKIISHQTVEKCHATNIIYENPNWIFSWLKLDISVTNGFKIYVYINGSLGSLFYQVFKCKPYRRRYCYSSDFLVPPGLEMVHIGLEMVSCQLGSSVPPTGKLNCYCFALSVCSSGLHNWSTASYIKFVHF